MSHDHRNVTKRNHFQVMEHDAVCQPEVYASDEDRTQHAEAAEAIRYILNFIGEAQSAKGIACRSLVLMHLLGIEDKMRHAKDFASIARACDVTRELARQVAGKMEAFAGLRSAGSRTDDQRRNCSKARRKVLNDK